MKHVLNKVLLQLEERKEITWEEFTKLKYVGPKVLSKFADLNQMADVNGDKAGNADAVDGEETRSAVPEALSTSHGAGKHVRPKKITDSDGSNTNGKTNCNLPTRVNRNKDLVSNAVIYKEYNKIDDFEYVPGFNTVAYNILRVLSNGDGLCKSQIYLNSEFLEDEITGLHIWSALKNLLQKRLVQKESKKYFLTCKGSSLCTILFDKTEKALKKSTDETMLLIDSREMRSKNDRGYFERKLPGSCSLNLVIGDFMWIRGDYVINTIIERKKCSDFVSSLYDGRFTEQKNRLKNTGLKHCVYLIEGLKSRDNFIDSAILKTKLEGFTVIETKDIEETVLFVKSIDYKIRMYGINNHENNEFVSVSDITFSNFSNKSLKTKGFSQKYLLYLGFLSIRGVSHVKAKFLRDYFQTFENLVKNCRDVDKLRQILNGMRINGQLLGKSAVDGILHLFT